MIKKNLLMRQKTLIKKHHSFNWSLEANLINLLLRYDRTYISYIYISVFDTFRYLSIVLRKKAALSGPPIARDYVY